MGGSITRGAGSPSGGVASGGVASGGILTDNHTASLVNNGSILMENDALSANSESRRLATDMVSDTTIQNFPVTNVEIGTPTTAINTAYRASSGRVINLGVTATTFTIRLKDESETVLQSTTTASLAQNGVAIWRHNSFVSNVSIAAHNTRSDIQRTTANEAYAISFAIGGCIISGSLSGTSSCSACVCTACACTPCGCS